MGHPPKKHGYISRGGETKKKKYFELEVALPGGPWKLVTIVSKLVYELFTGRKQRTYIGVKHSIYEVPAGHPSSENKAHME